MEQYTEGKKTKAIYEADEHNKVNNMMVNNKNDNNKKTNETRGSGGLQG